MGTSRCTVRHRDRVTIPKEQETVHETEIRYDAPCFPEIAITEE